MKKILLSVGLISALGMQQAKAQLVTETFNSGMPTTWSMFKVDNNTVSPTNWADPAVPTTLTAKAWMTRYRAAGDSVMLTTSNFAPPAKADRWLVSPSFTVNSANAILKWEDWQSFGAQYHDTLQIWVSTTGGATPSAFTQKVYEAEVTPYDATPYGVHGAPLGQFNGQSIKIAIRNNSYQQGAVRVDNVGTQIMTNSLDGSLDKVTFRTIVAATSTTPVTITVSNQGATTINSIEASYKVDNGTPVTQTFTNVNLTPLGSTNLTFTTNITNPTVGSHTITANILQVNGGNDLVTANNQGTTTFVVATGTTPRNAMIEEFTSSTCAPCKNFNVWYDPLLQTNNANNPTSKLNVIKYQMNWPSPNNDVSYNDDGFKRRSFYGVTGIPDHYVNGGAGIPLGSPQALYQTEMDDAKIPPAFLSITGSYTVKADSIIASVTVTPNFTLTGNYKLFMAATELHYQNPGNTTGQLDYYHAMRKMLPDGDGIAITSFTAGTPQTFTQRYKYTVATASAPVTQMSNIFWGSPIAGNLIAFVQDIPSKEIFNSVVIPAKWPTGMNDVNGGIGNTKIYPNPAKDGANLAFTLDKAASITIDVIDVIGKVVYTTSEKRGQGLQNVSLPCTNFAAGTYNVHIKSEEGSLTERLTVIK